MPSAVSPARTDRWCVVSGDTQEAGGVGHRRVAGAPGAGFTGTESSPGRRTSSGDGQEDGCTRVNASDSPALQSEPT